MVEHQHVDGSGEGYCSCGAERCSLPGCDMGCAHPGGWIERTELLQLRRPSAQDYLARPRLASEMPGWIGSEPPPGVLTEDDSFDRWPG
jgi:hypothetical protein